MNYRELLKEGIKSLEDNNIYSQQAQLLMLEYTKAKRIDLYASYQEVVEQEFIDIYRQGINRLISNEPLGYIVGYQPFFGYNIKVDQRVLIPRPETEELVGEVLMCIDEMFANKDSIRVIDVATGSGAIAISLAKEEPKLEMWASDISEDALMLARENAETLGAKVTFVKSDMLDELYNIDSFDVVVCNPPYIKASEDLDKSVTVYEPHIALFGGEDGLKFYRRVLKDVNRIINKRALIAFEIGYDQGDKLKALAREYFPIAEINIKQDINGKDRMLIIKLCLDKEINRRRL